MHMFCAVYMCIVNRHVYDFFCVVSASFAVVRLVYLPGGVQLLDGADGGEREGAGVLMHEVHGRRMHVMYLVGVFSMIACIPTCATQGS